MKPIKFRLANRQLGAPVNAEYSENVTGIDPLPVWTNGEECVSCWKLSWRERLSALLFGRVWISVLSGQTQPPIAAEAVREYLKYAEE